MPMTHRKSKGAPYVVCIENGEYDLDLIVGKIYRAAKPEPKDHASELRIIDESGEDYLYPADWFVPVELPRKAQRALTAAGG